MRADRLLAAVLLLQAHGRLTARDLARRLEVSERTIHRDMLALSGAGVPVRAERGAGGGWALLGSWRTTLTGLKDTEAETLFLARPPQSLADLGLGQAAEMAFLKLLAALPVASRLRAEEARQRIHIDPTGWRRAEDTIPFLPALQEAVWRGRRVRLGYRRGDGAEVEREVDPLGLVAKGSVWYLVAAVEGEPRVYRVSRMRSVEILSDASVRPPTFDLATFWERSASDFIANVPRLPATLRAQSAALERLRRGERYTRIVHEGALESDGWVLVEISYEDLRELAEHVVSFGGMVEALAPAELRAAALHLAEQAAALHRGH